jgi:hypothetical protein
VVEEDDDDITCGYCFGVLRVVFDESKRERMKKLN